MPNWRKVVTSGSAASFSSLSVDTFVSASTISANQFTGSLFGTASRAISSSFALTASFASTASYIINASISGAITNVDYVDFNTSATVTQPVAGRLSWNDSDGTLDLGMKGGTVVQQIGEETFYEVRNQTGTSIPNGTSLYASGVTAGSGRITAAPFVADGTIQEVRYLGLATEDISDGVNGFVTAFGYVRNLDTRGTTPSSVAVGNENWTVGDILYAHPTVPGKLTNIPPKDKVYVAIVIIRNATAGVLFVRPSSYGHIDDLHDVNINTGSLSSGDLLIYDSGSDYWTNSKQLTGSYGLTGSLEATSFTGSLSGTASQAISASFATSASQAVSSSFATTASYVAIFPYTGSAQITGSLAVNGTTATLGTGTVNTVPKFTSANIIGNSNITDSGTLITLGSNTTISSGGLGIGTTSLTGYALRINKQITGATTAYGVMVDGTIQSDVTADAFLFRTNINTQATSFNLSSIQHFRASQGTLGAGSAVGVQTGFFANSSLVGATTNYGFRGSIPSGTNRWNLYMDGTADNYMAGSLGIGTTTLTQYNLRISKNITGNPLSYGVMSEGTVQSDVTGTAYGYRTSISTVNSVFTLGDLVHYGTNQATIGATSTVTNQIGFLVNATLTGGTNNYGFRGLIAAGTNRWNLYMDGTANNYLNGSLGIGSTNLTAYNLRVAKNITGATDSYGISQSGVVQSDVTNNAFGYYNALVTQETAFTLSSYTHFRAVQATIGDGSTITNQSGFSVSSTLTGATNNYGFRGQIPLGANRWNLYMDGTADNYLAGNTGIGTPNPTEKLHVSTGIDADAGLISIALGGTNSNSRQAKIEKQTTGIRKLSIYSSLSSTVFEPISFYTGLGLERLTIFEGGNVVIGTSTDAGFRLDVSGSTRLNGNTQITGSLNVSDNITTKGTLTAQTLVVQTVTSSIIYSSGSNIFGNSLANTQVLTGSVTITGSLAVNGSNVILTNQTSSMSVLSSSYATSASYAETASYVLNAVSSSFATSASQAVSSSFASTASHADVFTIGGSQMMYSNTPSTSAGNNGIFATNTGSFAGAFYQYTLYSGSNARSENANVVWTSVTSSYTNYSTIDVGDTSGVVGSVVITGGQVQLNILTPTSGWTVRAVATFV